MDVRVYTDIRGANALREQDLIEALCSYSPKFEYCEAPNKAHQYFLIKERPLSLIIVNYFPDWHPFSDPNIIMTFTSGSMKRSKRLAEGFEKKAGLALLTEHECEALLNVPTSLEEALFRKLTESKKPEPVLFLN